MLLRVHVKGIIDALLKSTLPDKMLDFLCNLTKDGDYVPDGLLTYWELDRIDLDNYGAFVSIDANQRIMIASMFIFVKCLCQIVLLTPNYEARVRTNRRIIASVLCTLYF